MNGKARRLLVQVSQVVLKNGDKLPAQLVLVGVGARPCTDLFKGQLDMQPDGGLTVDASLRTSNQDVYAIGEPVGRLVALVITAWLK